MDTMKLVMYFSVNSLAEVFSGIISQLEAKGFVGKYEVTDVKISYGLPKCDYGQTVEISYRENPQAYDMPNKELAKQVLVAA